MDGHEFEMFMAEVLKKNGYKNVHRTKGSGDYGADIVAELDGVKYAFQCKRFESKVGPKPIGEVLRGMNHYNCQKGVVITNNYYTKQAQNESIINNIELWDRNKIIGLCKIEKTKVNEEKEYDNDDPIKNNNNSINWKIIGIAVGIVLFICIVICIAIGIVWNIGNNYSNDVGTGTQTTNSSLNKDNKQNESIKENQIVSSDLAKELSNYINTCVNSEQLEVNVTENTMSVYRISIEYILKDTNHSREECEELFKSEITKIYDMLKNKEIVKGNTLGSGDYKNLGILISLSYKKKNTRGFEHNVAIGVTSLTYSTDKWKKSYEDVMQKELINREYEKMNK